MRSYVAAKTESSSLVNAVPQLFRAVELLLKSRLEQVDPQGLVDHPNNPAVLSRLANIAVIVTPAERDTIAKLRRLRNNLQHGTAKFNHRAGLAVCRAILIFLNRFLDVELNMYLGDLVHEDDWFRLLAIPEIAATADQVTEAYLKEVNQQPRATVETCPRCRRDAMVRPDPRTGISCCYCGYHPITSDEIGK